MISTWFFNGKSIRGSVIPVRIIFGFCLMLPIVFMSSHAHEFWIDLERGHIPPGDIISGDLKVGEMLEGSPYPYLTDRFRRFSVSVSGRSSDVTGSEGDLPALNYRSVTDGLHVISHETTDFYITYPDFDAFVEYLEYEGLTRFSEIHRQRNLPLTEFSERYIRCVKALVQVGNVSPSHTDLFTQMPFEFVALTNPYQSGTNHITVQLLWQGAPLSNWPINVFHNSGQKTPIRVMTDASGSAVIDISIQGEYMLNAVHLQEVEDFPVVWESHWASLSLIAN